VFENTDEFKVALEKLMDELKAKKEVEVEIEFEGEIEVEIDVD
jgi:hypothetical protein